MAAIAERIECIEFGQHLRRRLGARRAPVELYNVAKFAEKRTAPRKLHADIHVLFELQEVEARRWRLRDVRLKFERFEESPAFAAPPRSDKLVDNPFRLANHPEIGGCIDLRARSWIGTADCDRLSGPLYQLNDF